VCIPWINIIIFHVHHNFTIVFNYLKIYPNVYHDGTEQNPSCNITPRNTSYLCRTSPRHFSRAPILLQIIWQVVILQWKHWWKSVVCSNFRDILLCSTASVGRNITNIGPIVIMGPSVTTDKLRNEPLSEHNPQNDHEMDSPNID
jgi:hypothetical protein